VSLGCRCSQAATFKTLQQRRYACPFDWIFSSAQMITHCLRDDFGAFLDRSKYFLNATLVDAIGLRPGSAPRERKIIGHKVYSTMMGGVGKGAIFNHRDPLHNDADYEYTERTVERLRCVLASQDRKLFTIINLNKQLWLEEDIRELFKELCSATKNFVLIAVDCMRNLGGRARNLPPEELEQDVQGDSQLLMYRLPCVGDNTGSYFREEFDAARMRALVISPYRFDLVEDPLSLPAHLESQTPVAPQANDLKNDNVVRGHLSRSSLPQKAPHACGADKALPPAAAAQVSSYEEATAALTPVRRWTSRRQHR